MGDLYLWTYKASPFTKAISCQVISPEGPDSPHVDRPVHALGLTDTRLSDMYPDTHGILECSVYGRYPERPYDDGPPYLGSLSVRPVIVNIAFTTEG